MKARVCELFEVRQHEFTNFSLPCEGRFRANTSPVQFNVHELLFAARPFCRMCKRELFAFGRHGNRWLMICLNCSL